MNYQDWRKKKLLKLIGLADSQIDPNRPTDFLVNNRQEILKTKLREYNMWYSGDSDNLLNFYTRQDMIDYNYEPFFDRNKRSYFYCISSTEGDIKRTHSGLPRNIVDTLVNIIGVPTSEVTDLSGSLGAEEKSEKVAKNANAVLKRILRNNKFERMFLQEQLPLTLVEGWGCWKINYDTSISDTPILLYYRADAVDFDYVANQIVQITFKDYYADEKNNKYLLLETRRREMEKTASGLSLPCLIIEKELFKYGEDSSLEPVRLTDLPQLKDVNPKLKISNYSGFLASPCIVYEDSTGDAYGRSIYTGKIDLFDDLDQVLSQSSNTVRRSTPHEYFNANYLERDLETGLPLQPKVFDRKYIMFNGGRDAQGVSTMAEPVQVTQPALNFQQYTAEAQAIVMQILNGIMSPATLGIRDGISNENGVSEREKEKITIFTRNTIIAEEMLILEELFNELLCCNELMHTGKITARDYDIAVNFSEFADESLESRMETLLVAYNAGIISPELVVDKLWKDSLTDEQKAKELEYIHGKEMQADPMAQAMMGQMGAEMGGMNAYDQAGMEAPVDATTNPGGVGSGMGFGSY